MAASKVKRLPAFKQPKLQVYEALYNLNLAFQAIALNIEHLDDAEAIPLDVLRLYRTQAEELRSAMNHRITDVLITREELDWSHYGKERIAQEKRLK